MTRRSVALADGWRVKDYLSTDAAIAAAGHGWAGHGWLPARVPGSVAADVWRAGEAPSPYHERDSRALEWVAERAWRYRRVIRVPPLAVNEAAWLRFEGVDHACVVLLDGVELTRHAGMFVPFEVRLPPSAGDRDQCLDVVVEPAPPSEPQVGRTSRVAIHKSRMSYGWDFCPRLIHQGVWRPVSLEVGGPWRLLDVWARPAWTDERRLDGRLAVTVSVAAVAASGVAAPRVRVTLRDGDHPLATGLAAVRTIATLTLDVPAPRPWRPAGMGQAVVHELLVELLADDEVLDRRLVPVGFREARLVRNEGGPADAPGYTLEVDGQRRPITGVDWAPADIHHGVPRREHVEHLLRVARDAGVNLVRVWGGGLIEDDTFFGLCDRFGIFVWQEFAQSSSGLESVPSSDPAFVDSMRREARAIVPLCRNHPSLLIWGGGNELADDRPLDEDRSPVLAALRDVVADLDPDRAWLPTSPSGPWFHDVPDAARWGPDAPWDVHGPWEHQGLADHNPRYDAGTSLLTSEFGVEGMANRRLHEALIDEPDRWPPTRDNPVYRHLGDWWINEPLVQAAFGGGITDLDVLRRASHHLQADGLRYAVEAHRRRWPRCAGTLPWQLAESFPNAWCTALIDHRGDPKPAWHALARAYRPVHVCARFDRWAWGGHERRPFEADIWAWSIDRPLVDGRVEAALSRPDGTVLARETWPAQVRDDRPRQLGRLASSLPDELIVLRLVLVAADGAALATTTYVISGTADLGPLRSLAPARVRVRRVDPVTADRWTLELAHEGGPAALGLSITDDRPIAVPGWLEAADGWFDLLPGERRIVEARWAGAPKDGRRARVHGWNVDVLVA